MNFHKTNTPVYQHPDKETEHYQHPRSPSVHEDINYADFEQHRLALPTLILYINALIQHALF